MCMSSVQEFKQGYLWNPYLFIIISLIIFTDIRTEFHRALALGKLDHLFFMEIYT